MTLDDTTRIRTEAEIHRALLAFRLISVSDVVAWADRQIGKAETPASELVEIALSSSLHASEVGNLLEAVRGSAVRESFLRGLFSRLAELLGHDSNLLSAIGHMLYRMAVDEQFRGLPAEDYLFSVDDDVNGAWVENELVKTGLIRALRDLSMNPYAESEAVWKSWYDVRGDIGGDAGE
jgi:hypothetical protein